MGERSQDFDDLLIQKMLERNLDTTVIDYVKAHGHRIYGGYDFDDPQDIEILNNKLEHIAQQSESLGTVDAARDERALRSFVTILSTKH